MQGSGPSVFIGFFAALIILALVFRTVAATVLPLASAAVALISGLGVIYILSHGINVSNITPYLAELMVIGVGIDYALFIVTRHRRNLRRGMRMHESIVTAINTSGRAVLFAGTTVCIAILGLIALGVSFFNGMAVATAIAVGFTMVASLTLLPALLSLFGLRCCRASSGRRAGRQLHQRPPDRVLGPLVGVRRPPPRPRRDRFGRAHDRSSDPVLLACDSATATRAVTRRARRPVSDTT